MHLKVGLLAQTQRTVSRRARSQCGVKRAQVGAQNLGGSKGIIKPDANGWFVGTSQFLETTIRPKNFQADIKNRQTIRHLRKEPSRLRKQARVAKVPDVGIQETQTGELRPAQEPQRIFHARSSNRDEPIGQRGRQRFCLLVFPAKHKNSG